MSQGDHDDLNIEEVMRRLEAAERLLREARTLLDHGRSGTAESDSESVAEAPGPAQPSSTPAPPGPSGAVSDLDPALLARHAPPGSEESYQSAIAALFRLAMEAPDDSVIVSELLARLMHAEAVAGDRAIESLMAFSWRRFAKQYGVYLASPEDPASFAIAHTRPRDISGASQLKAYLQAPRRSPVPVELARDEGADGAWRVVAFSL
jgi:hypothetical protein